MNPASAEVRLRPADTPARGWSWQSWGSVFPTRSLLSFRSVLSIGSAGSILSIGSAGSILSIGSAGSILSIGSAGSILSIESGRSILGWRRRPMADERRLEPLSLPAS